MNDSTATAINFKRLFAEGTAIVISILLAFAIDAWWEDRQDRIKEQELLASLSAEFQRNLEGLQLALTYRKAASTSIDQLFEAAAGQRQMQDRQLDKLLSDMAWAGDAEFSNGILSGAIQSSDIQLIQNEELRNLLSGLPSLYNLVLRMEDSELMTLRQDLMPFLFKNAFVPQIANVIEGMPGSGINADAARFPVSKQVDHSNLLQNDEFLGIITLKRWDHVDAIWAYGRIQSEFERAIELIDTELVK